MIKTFYFNNNSSNTYVIGELNKPAIVIDLGDATNKVTDYINNYHLGSCLGVLLTHGHYDHIRGLNNFFKHFPNTTLFVQFDEDKLLTDTFLNCSKMCGESITVQHQNKYLFDDEDEIKFYDNLMFKVIQTPFHTKGSTCFLCEKENALFTGDTLFKGSIGRTDLPTGNNKTVNDSLKKIINLNPELNIYPGHGDLTNLKRELRYNMFLRLED